MINKQGILDLTQRLIDENPGTLKDPPMYLGHVEATYDVAEQVLSEIFSEYPRINKFMNPLILTAAGFHDIGRPLNKNQIFHELRGARWLEQHAQAEGITSNHDESLLIAQMITPHFIVSEQFAEPENAEIRKEFESIDPILLIPRTWEESIITYADMCNLSGERCSYEKRFADILERYRPGTHWAKSNPGLIETMQKGLPRVRQICEKVQALSEGKLSEIEIGRYGFL